MTNRIALGVDIGGTKVAAGLVDERGQILFNTRVPMLVTGTADQAMDGVNSAITQALTAAQGVKLSGIGVASPGPLELPAGIVVHTPNLPCWSNFPLGDEVRRKYQLPTWIENDANAAGLAEALWGAGVGYGSVFYTTIGTGIGTAIVLNGELYRGRTGNAAESGHMTIDLRGPCVCGCGKRGCFEGLASGTAIARRAREAVLGHRASMLLSLVEGEADKITARTVAEAWHAGDVLATQIMAETAEYLAVWLGNIVDVLEPDVFVFGGGLGPLMSEWFDFVRQRLPSSSINAHCTDIPLVQAKYGNDAGIAGAAALCFQSASATAV